MKIHRSIISTACPLKGHGNAGVHPGQATRPSHGRLTDIQPFTLTFALQGNLEFNFKKKDNNNNYRQHHTEYITITNTYNKHTNQHILYTHYICYKIVHCFPTENLAGLCNITQTLYWTLQVIGPKHRSLVS